MKDLAIMIQNQTEPLHARLLVAQKDIQKLKDAAYAEHRLVTKMGEQIKTLSKMVQTLQEQLQDDGK